VGHSLAASFGFSGIALIAILPFQLIKGISEHASLNPTAMELFELVEMGIVYVDTLLLLFVIVVYSILFIVEQWRAMSMVLGSSGKK
jgi:hypothetical protein